MRNFFTPVRLVKGERSLSFPPSHLNGRWQGLLPLLAETLRTLSNKGNQPTTAINICVSIDSLKALRVIANGSYPKN